MLEPWQIVEHVGRALESIDPLFRHRRVLVTAGPTREALDPVRYLGNRSSGRMGFALAQAAWRRGAHVTLVSGPSSLETPEGVERIDVETAQEMHRAVADRLPDMDVSIFAAAVADYRPAQSREGKLKREKEGDALEIALTSNPDIAAETRALRKDGSVAVGFALETEDLLENARAKLERKGFDLLVANDAGAQGSGFEVDTNQVTLLRRDGEPEELPLLSKDEVAEKILTRVADLLEPAT
jgi:phosphopantothenoylcysteine decarboxylase/phosphopantothenate--cysteine ligase